MCVNQRKYLNTFYAKKPNFFRTLFHFDFRSVVGNGSLRIRP